MLNRVTFKDDQIRRAIGKEVIESYVYEIVSQLSTVTWITQEFEYQKGGNSVLSSDVISAEGDKVIFYDTKSITPSLKLRKFDAAEIDYTKWGFNSYAMLDGTEEVSGKSDSSVASVEDGHLSLKAIKTEDGYKVSHSFNTGKTMSFKYGYVEIRAKVPFGAGMWPAFWLKSDIGDYGKGQAQIDKLVARAGYEPNLAYSSEVDVFEVFGNEYARSNLHRWWKADGTDEMVSSLGTITSYKLTEYDWHTYGFEWTSKYIKMYIDGVSYQTYDLSKCFGEGASDDLSGFNTTMCLIFNNHLRLASDGYGDSALNDTYSVGDIISDLQIDYVRLYQNSKGALYTFNLDD